MRSRKSVASLVDDITIQSLGSLCGRGTYGLGLSAKHSQVGPKYLRTTDMISGSIRWDTVPYCEADDEQRITASLKHGDIVISRTGANAGASAYVSHPPAGAVFAGYLVRFRVDPDLADSRFLGYVLRSRLWNDYVANTRTGSAQPQLNAVRMSEFSFPCPPVDEQRWIARYLGSFDDLIETNDRLISPLVALAGTLFARQFGNLAIQDSHSAIRFSELISIISGGTPRTAISDYWDGPIPWFSVVDAPAPPQSWVLETRRHITQLGLDNSPANLLPVGAVILSARGTVGKVALVGTPMAMNQSCYALTCALGGRGYFTYFATRSIVEELRQSAHGSVFDTITRATLDGLLVRKVTRDEVAAFEEEVSVLMDAARELAEEGRQLRQTRDELLSLMMSGTFRVDAISGVGVKGD